MKLFCNDNRASRFSLKCISISQGSLSYRFAETQSIYATLYGGLLFSDLFNHYRERNNYTYSLTDQQANTKFIYRENHPGRMKITHINSEGNRGVDPETLCVLVPNTVYDINNYNKEFYCYQIFITRTYAKELDTNEISVLIERYKNIETKLIDTKCDRNNTTNFIKKIDGIYGYGLQL
ncbi:hypothetical protein H8356DRAFT_1356585 [Neocallimastix lanati (nom. inval.)]|nr:hypothetical protein H8356DRAFT_1356585 [Neocallimastix sp. JGI-2020a]